MKRKLLYDVRYIHKVVNIYTLLKLFSINKHKPNSDTIYTFYARVQHKKINK